MEDAQPSRCDYCLLTASANRKGEAEELLICKDCGAKGDNILYQKFHIQIHSV